MGTAEAHLVGVGVPHQRGEAAALHHRDVADAFGALAQAKIQQAQVGGQQLQPVAGAPSGKGASLNHWSSGSLSSTARALDHCNGPEGSDPRSIVGRCSYSTPLSGCASNGSPTCRYSSSTA